jgi:DNA-binding NtrC family response regulator
MPPPGSDSRLRARSVVVADVPTLIARAPAMLPVLRTLERVARTNVSVLIVGEQGTGKAVVARAIHEASERASGPFVAVDAGGLVSGVFELAHGGTLFLDEIGRMPPEHQAQLLRALQMAADVRVLAATRLDLRREVDAGRFREDLFHRLNAVELRLPPLRERGDDVPLLAQHFLDRLAHRYASRGWTFAPSALRALVDHAWPGNVRELEHVIERALLVAQGDAIVAEDLGLRSRSSGVANDGDVLTLDQVEVLAIHRALVHTGGRVNDAATILGLSRSALYRRLQHHGIKSR